MSVPYEKIVAEDLNLGVGAVSVTMPGGGSATGNKINLGTLGALAFAGSRVSTQSISASTLTTVQLEVEDLDEGGWFDPTTYTFTPLIAGVYLITAQVTLAAFTGTLTAEIYRGATSVGKVDVVRAALAATAQVSALVSMNGSSDAITIKVTHTNASPVNVTAANAAGILLGGL
jgi:hypothetical protein